MCEERKGFFLETMSVSSFTSRDPMCYPGDMIFHLENHLHLHNIYLDFSPSKRGRLEILEIRTGISMTFRVYNPEEVEPSPPPIPPLSYLGLVFPFDPDRDLPFLPGSLVCSMSGQVVPSSFLTFSNYRVIIASRTVNRNHVSVVKNPHRRRCIHRLSLRSGEKSGIVRVRRKETGEIKC